MAGKSKPPARVPGFYRKSAGARFFVNASPGPRSRVAYPDIGWVVGAPNRLFTEMKFYLT